MYFFNGLDRFRNTFIWEVDYANLNAPHIVKTLIRVNQLTSDYLSSP